MTERKTDNPDYFKNYYQRNKVKMKENSRKSYLRKKGITDIDKNNLLIVRKNVIVRFD